MYNNKIRLFSLLSIAAFLTINSVHGYCPPFLKVKKHLKKIERQERFIQMSPEELNKRKEELDLQYDATKKRRSEVDNERSLCQEQYKEQEKRYSTEHNPAGMLHACSECTSVSVKLLDDLSEMNREKKQIQEVLEQHEQKNLIPVDNEHKQILLNFIKVDQEMDSCRKQYPYPDPQKGFGKEQDPCESLHAAWRKATGRVDKAYFERKKERRSKK